MSQPSDPSTSSPSGFLPTEAQTEQPAPLREDQIQNAVAFLSHPKVRSSPIATKRSFLDKKGLTSAEIDEAFRRVPPEAVEATPGAAQSAGSQPAFAPTAAGQGVSAAVVPVQAPSVGAPTPGSPHAGIRWSQVVLGAGVVAAGVYAVQKYVLPYAYDWFGQMVAGMRREQQQQLQEVRQAVESLQQADTELTGAIQQLTDSLRELKQEMQQNAAVQKGALTIADLRQELRTLHTTAAEFGGRNAQAGEVQALQGEVDALKAALKQLTTAQQAGDGRRAAAAGYPPSGVPSSYAAGRPYRDPWPLPDEDDAENAQNGYRRGAGYGPPGSLLHGPRDGDRGTGGTTGVPAEEEPASNRLSFTELADMMKRGITPSNVRTDINDKPPDPTRPASSARLAAPRKPWEAMEAPGPAYAPGSAAYAPWANGSSPAPGASSMPMPSNGDLAGAATHGGPSERLISHGLLPDPGAPGTSVFAGVQHGEEDAPAASAQEPAGIEGAAPDRDAPGSAAAAAMADASSQQLARTSSGRSAGASSDAGPQVPPSVWRPPSLPAPTVKSAPSSISGGSEAGGYTPTEP